MQTEACETGSLPTPDASVDRDDVLDMTCERQTFLPAHSLQPMRRVLYKQLDNNHGSTKI